MQLFKNGRRRLAQGLGAVLLSTLMPTMSVQAETYGPVKAGESLWTIARKAAPGKNPTQVMQALFASNPNAFVNGDMSRLKVGASLNLDTSAVAATSAAAAAAPAPAAVKPAAKASTSATSAQTPKPTATPPSAAAAGSPATAPAASTQPAAATTPSPTPSGVAAAEIVKLVGRASAATEQGDIRPLSQGNPVNTGETVVTAPASFVRMKLSDGGYILLRPSTRFQIAQYKYTDSADDSVGLFNLLKGGFRAVTGTIGKRNKNAVSYRTAVATIGIRGTDLEAIDCTDGCPDLATDIDPGLYFKTHAGEIDVAGKQFPAGTGGFKPVTGDPTAIKFASDKNPLNNDPTPTADPNECGGT